MMALSREHGHTVVEDVASSLHALIQPARSMGIFIDGYGESLTTTVVDGIDQGDVELIRMLREMVGTGHA